MDRITPAIAKMRATIATGQKLDGTGPIDPDSLARLDRSLDNGPAEWVAYQNAQARAHATGILSTAEAQVVYMALGGESPGPGGWAADADLATKVVITQVLSEIVGRRVA